MYKDTRYRNEPGRKEYLIRYSHELRRKRKVKLVKLKEGKCLICGYSKCIGALDFHHRDPKEKDFQLNNRALGRKWEVILKEAEKCDLLCANCHREFHFVEGC